MKLLANENFPLDSVKYLMKQGFDVKSVGIDFSGISDDEVMRLAIAEKILRSIKFDRFYGEI